jgi:hypothetical protein
MQIDHIAATHFFRGIWSNCDFWRELPPKSNFMGFSLTWSTEIPPISTEMCLTSEPNGTHMQPRLMPPALLNSRVCTQSDRWPRRSNHQPVPILSLTGPTPNLGIRFDHSALGQPARHPLTERHTFRPSTPILMRLVKLRTSATKDW